MCSPGRQNKAQARETLVIQPPLSSEVGHDMRFWLKPSPFRMLVARPSTSCASCKKNRATSHRREHKVGADRGSGNRPIVWGKSSCDVDFKHVGLLFQRWFLRFTSSFMCLQ